MDVLEYERAVNGTVPWTRVALGSASATFRGEVARRRLGPLTLMRVYNSGALRWNRSHRTATTASRYFVVRLQLRGDVRQTVFGRSECTARGSIVLLDSRIAISGMIIGEAEHLIVKIPAWFLHRAIPWLGPSCATSFDGAHGSGRVLAELIRATWSEIDRLGEHDHQILPDCLLRLLESSLLGNGTHEPSTRRAEVRYQRIRQLIDKHAADPEFCAATVCAELGISRSTLYENVQKAGTTFSTLLWKARLEGVRRRLEDPACALVTLTDLALSHGFQDLSHFSRKFKQAYGVSPRRFRQRRVPPSRDAE